ncbi:MAG: XRE family transcriptional regulator [Methanobacteriaceae archaeon]|jgi:transcriptional regulator with XRE-family HTH domain|nr:MAG: DNA-binding protein [Methanobacterium sp. BRmetb2]MCC7558275.1 XRE family transcriptional regulator [Methanobacteriaceae archaeon]
MSEKNQLGSKIRQIRENNQMSLEDLSKASNISIEELDSIENGELIPSLTPLIKIARALGVRLGTFLDDAPQTGPVVSKSGQYENIILFSGKENHPDQSKLEFYALASGKQDRHMEPFIIDVHPPDNQDYKLSSHEGEEFVYIMDGKIEILYGTERYLLSKGDSIYYDSIIPHDLHAYGEKDAKILAVVYTPF